MALEEVHCVNAECFGDPIYHEHGRISLTALNATEVGLMDARSVSQLFLA